MGSAHHHSSANKAAHVSLMLIVWFFLRPGHIMRDRYV